MCRAALVYGGCAQFDYVLNWRELTDTLVDARGRWWTGDSIIL